MPNEILQQFVCILVLQDETGGVNDLTEILDELAALRRKLVDVERRVIPNIFKTCIKLPIGGKTTVPEGFNGAKKTDLRENVRSRQMNGETLRLIS